MERFIFNANRFVQPGYEKASGDWNESDTKEIAKLRALFPELFEWGDLAIGSAWGDYSQDIYAVNWVEWIKDRDNGFLAYLYINHKNPGFNFGGTGLYERDIDILGENTPWLSNSELPDWCKP